MAKICQLVNQVMDSGYLTTEVENILRQLFVQENGLEDLDALAVLQQAIACGIVKRESCSLAKANQNTNHYEDSPHENSAHEKRLVYSGQESW